MPLKKKWEIGDKLLAHYQGEVYYAAKIVDIQHDKDGQTHYKIHYDGWGTRYDQIFSEGEIQTKWKEYTEQAADEAKALQNAAKGGRSGRKKDDTRKSEGGGSNSRASTPSQTGSKLSEKTTKNARRSEAVPAEQPIPDVTRTRKEVVISIPDILKQIMVDDYDMVTRQGRLPSLPAKNTVDQIMRDYVKSLGRSVSQDEQLVVNYKDGSPEATLSTNSNTMMDCALGLQEFFDVTFGAHLLTKFERNQYASILEDHKAKQITAPGPKRARLRTETEIEEGKAFKPSAVYGLAHLLRLFVRFGTLIQCAPWGDRALSSIVKHTHDFLVFLAKNCNTYYDRDAYETPDPAYVKTAYA
ncbi:unnamed protein product, partial [Mesorhabditis belari]|uniref:MRG domain-containing protein n=1 Tax=Mesorhabditis belari TaxID=2138241 RepID=A0AAF3ETV1_9BILA